MIDWINVIGLIVVIIIIFMVCRELVCWYWKLNQIITILDKIADSLNKDKNGIKIETIAEMENTFKK